MADLKKFAQIQIGGGGKRKYPAKTKINLIEKENRLKQNVIAIVVFACFMCALAVFTKFMVVDKINEVSQAEQRYDTAQKALETLQAQNENYDRVAEEYSHYGNSMLNDDELSLQDRAKMMDVIDQKVKVDSGIQSIVISGNTATLTIEKTTLAEVSDVVAALEESDIVQYVAPSTAERQVDQDETVVSSSGEVTVPAQNYVTAQIVVTFTSPYDHSSVSSSSEETLSDQLADRKTETEQEGMNY